MVFSADLYGNAKVGLGIKIRVGTAIACRKIFLKKTRIFFCGSKGYIKKKGLELFAVSYLWKKIKAVFFMIEYVGGKGKTPPAPPAK